MMNFHYGSSIKARTNFVGRFLHYVGRLRIDHKLHVDHHTTKEASPEDGANQQGREIISAEYANHAEGPAMRYLPFSFLFPGWNFAKAPVTQTKDDAAFFERLAIAAAAAEKKHGEVLQKKYGAKMPSVKQPESSSQADQLAVGLGAKILRR
jgi:hypothetical protein